MNHAAPTAAQGLHVAIIMDGNGRWAQARGLNRLAGHRAGASRVRDVVAACPALGVRYLTLYAFSTENWKRSRREVAGLMAMFARTIREEGEKLAAEGVRVRFIGDRGRLSPVLTHLFDDLEQRTRANDRLHLTAAINYGGRDEITRAMRALARDVSAGLIDPDAIDESAIAARLDTAALPDPDLVIRTSGEVRVSNFLPWQAAYAEYDFQPVLWPDFSPEHLAACLDRFGLRERRFGGVRA